jgi:esterase/lipase
MPSTEARTGYASIGDLEMYYEVRGTGRPLLLLHGAYMTVELLDPLRSRLAETRQVVAPELQGHGRTADVDRPLTYEQMADDAAALLGALELEEADVVGYSMGGGVACSSPSVTRRRSASWSSPRPATAWTACIPWRWRCSRRSPRRCSPDRRSRRRT